MKKLFAIGLLLIAVFLSGCSSMGNRLVKMSTDTLGGDYRVTLFSGGHAVKIWEVENSIINEEQGSDGWFFSCKNKLIRISGEVVVEPLSFENSSKSIPSIICN